MKKQTIITIVLLILIALLLTSCSLRNKPESKVNTTTAANSEPDSMKNPPLQVYDYEFVLSDKARDVPPLFSLSPDIPKIFRVVNKRNTEASFAIPQLDIIERIGSGEIKYIEVRPIRIGFYQMTLNGASYATFQVK